MAVGDTLVNASSSFNSTGGHNTIVGSISGSSYVNDEESNIILGSGITGIANESNILRIGLSTGSSTNQINKAFVCGINGITVVGSAVFVTGSDQLGILLSTQRVKNNITDMSAYSSRILQLRPVTFTYTVGEDTTSIQSGLIAEEVKEVMPELVVYDVDGLPQTVKYHELPSLLLNELQKAIIVINDLKARIIALESQP